ncbi:unnamed protein product [Oikopleura dioica]|uniref:Transcription factor IIIC subunit 5 HTH domain-containing protein n=1 Tax=Oikopleura dioica TaxID=34765 RepID=E4X7A6_OIKDI|nr:unnamed protein product [Oikopleura dioica]
MSNNENIKSYESARHTAEIVELKPCIDEIEMINNSAEMDMIELNEIPPEVEEIRMNGSNVSITPRSLICVELPVKVENPEKIIKALGGRDVLLDTFNDVGTSQYTKRRLNFSFRPDDPHAHAACGDPCITENALVLIQKLRSKKNPMKTKVRMKIIGCSSIAYKFQSPADCQLLPILPFENNGPLRSVLPSFDPDSEAIIDTIINSDLPDGGNPCELNRALEEYFAKPDIPSFLPPIFFLQSDKPTMYLFRDPPNKSKKKDQTAIEVSRKRRIGFSVEIRFIENRTTIPMELSEQAKKNEAFFRARKDAQKVIALFEERPIWSKHALMDLTGLKSDTMKELLPMIAFYWKTGPWARLWNRFGFNPLKEKIEGRKYQSIDVRVNMDTSIHVKRRTMAKLPNLSVYNTILKDGPMEWAHEAQRIIYAKKKEDDERSTRENSTDHIYTTGCMPPRRQMFYQVCDVILPEVQAKIKDNSSLTLRNGSELKFYICFR